jgi:hypothetical protein
VFFEIGLTSVFYFKPTRSTNHTFSKVSKSYHMLDLTSQVEPGVSRLSIAVPTPNSFRTSIESIDYFIFQD